MSSLSTENNPDIQSEWNSKGESYAKEVTKMLEFIEKNGWESWEEEEGEEPEDEREHLVNEVIQRLRQANYENEVERFRKKFPPSHAPLIPILEERAQNVEQLHFIDGQKIVFVVSAYDGKHAYLLDDDCIIKLDETISAIGKSKQNNIFAIATETKISTFKGWEGELICEFTLNETAQLGITELIPFNDGNKLLIVTSEGIYLVSKNEEKLIHPLNEENEEDWSSNIDMENATLSNDNTYIVAGDQDSYHIIMDSEGNILGGVGPQSSYARFCLFSKDDSQLITNGCYFYNGVTIGVDSNTLNGIDIEAEIEELDAESEQYKIIDKDMAVYAGLSTSSYYILGDAGGTIKAIDKNGNEIWRHFLGSSLSGMAISDDEQTLWVGSSSGMLHKLILGKGHRDTHTIGNGNHYEEFRLISWKDEPQIWKW